MVVFLQAGPMAMDSLGWGINKIQCQSSKKFNWRWILVPFILPALSLVELPIRWWFVSKSLCTLSDTTAITAWDITSKAAAPSHSEFAAKSKSRRHAAAMLTHWSWALREQFWDVDLAEVVSWVATCAAITFCQQSPCHQQFRVEWLTSSPTHNWTFQFSWMSRERFTFVVQLVHCLDTATTSRIFSPWKSVQWFYAHAWYARRQKCKATKRGSMTLPAVIFKCGLQMNQNPYILVGIPFELGRHTWPKWSTARWRRYQCRRMERGGRWPFKTTHGRLTMRMASTYMRTCLMRSLRPFWNCFNSLMNMMMKPDFPVSAPAHLSDPSPATICVVAWSIVFTLIFMHWLQTWWNKDWPSYGSGRHDKV